MDQFPALMHLAWLKARLLSLDCVLACQVLAVRDHRDVPGRLTPMHCPLPRPGNPVALPKGGSLPRKY